jgi:hypothetical protein
MVGDSLVKTALSTAHPSDGSRETLAGEWRAREGGEVVVRLSARGRGSQRNRGCTAATTRLLAVELNAASSA